jgi:hypothetical protein
MHLKIMYPKHLERRLKMIKNNPCMIRCLDCVHIKIIDKKIKCGNEYFDEVKYQEGILYTPFDFDCFEFEQSMRKD